MQLLGADGSINQQNAAGMDASCLVSLEIAGKKKPHTVGEQLIVPCAKTVVKLALGKRVRKTFRKVLSAAEYVSFLCISKNR